MRRTVLIAIALFLLAWAVFGQTRSFAFINYDDPGHAGARPELRQGLSPEGVRWAFTTTFVGNYIPITGLTFLADYAMHGLDAGGYHVTNVALHAMNGVLLFLFLIRTTGAPWRSAAVAALFLVHPLRAESVAWISSRKDLTCGLFWILTMHAYVSYARKPRFTAYALVFTGVCLAVLSKPMAVTLPFALLLLDVWPLRRIFVSSGEPTGRRPSIKWLVAEKAPLLIPIGVASALTLSIQRSAGAVSPLDRLPIGARFGNAAISYAEYIVHSIVPFHLIPLYPYPEDQSRLLTIGLGLYVVGAGISAAVIVAARVLPALAVGWFWYLGLLVPVLGIVQVGAQSMADRYTYLPHIGLLIAIVWGVARYCQRVPRGRALAGAIAAVAIAGYATLGYRQTSHWRDSITLWSYTVGVMPENAIAQSLLGDAFLQKGELVAARTHLNAAVEIQRSLRPALLSLAKLNVQEGRLDAALIRCKQLVAADPRDPDAHTTWASILIRQGQPTAALQHTDVALRTAPRHADALINRGAALLYLGDYQDAIVSLEKATRLAPDDAVAYSNLATAHYALGHYQEARRFCDMALARDPDYGPALALQGDLNALPSR